MTCSMGSGAIALLVALAGCDQEVEISPDGGPAGDLGDQSSIAPLTELVVARVEGIHSPDGAATYWRAAMPGRVTLVAQPMITPRPEKLTTEGLTVQAVHDGSTLAVRLQWEDTELSEAGGLAMFSDAVALEFPLRAEDTLPPVMMGASGLPVHLFHWRAQYQRDAERGKPEIQDLYPNASIDMYAMDFKETQGGSREEREMFNPGVALGNPQSSHKSGVDEIVAEGFSTSAVQAGHGSAGKGTWADGRWTVVITRPLVIEGGSTLTPGGASSVAFAVWQGGLGEVGSRKSLTMAWTPVRMSP